MRITSADELGRFVRERRHQLDLTQIRLATIAKVSRRWLSDVEAGKETAELGRVFRTLHALGIAIHIVPVEETSELNLDDVLARHSKAGGLA